MSHINEGDQRYLQGLPITIIDINSRDQRFSYVHGHHEFQRAGFGDLLPEKPGVVIIGDKK